MSTKFNSKSVAIITTCGFRAYIRIITFDDINKSINKSNKSYFEYNFTNAFKWISQLTLKKF